MLTPTRTNRSCTNKQETDSHRMAVGILYIMTYCQSQLCNGLQKDIAAFLHSHGLSDIGIDAMHAMGLSTSRQTLHSFIRNTQTHHQQRVHMKIKEAIEKGRRISLMVDDYTNVHTFRRPQFEQSVDVAHMATVLIRIFDEPAIPAHGDGIGQANDPAGVDIELLSDKFVEEMTDVLKPFTQTAPQEVLAQFFNADNERRRLTTHMYGEDNNIRRHRGVQNSLLIDCVEQPLKSVFNFREAANVFLQTPLAEYLDKYCVVTPGDWPAQFYNRQIALNDQFQPECLRNIVPSMGPLHISLNSQEHVVRKHILFFKKLHRALFNRELANKPRPWRVTLLLELAYGGWTLIRQPVLDRLEKFKDVQFLTLLHLVDNNIPISLSIYSVLFKSNSYQPYFSAIMQLWVMVWCYKRRHYDKSLLVWLAQRLYWANIQHPLLEALAQNLHEEDEYPIEHFHGQIRGETNEYDNANTIRQKALWIDSTKDQLHNFSSWFLPPPRAHFSANQLRRLKIKAAKFILTVIRNICTHPFSGQEQPRHPGQRKTTSKWVLPDLFGGAVVPNVLLPLGYQFRAHRQLSTRFGIHQPLVPSQQQTCDYSPCLVATGRVVLFRCGHSFHHQCLDNSEQSVDHCFICAAGVVTEVQEKATTARHAMFHPNANNGQDNQSDSDSDDGEDEHGDLGAHHAPGITQHEAHAHIVHLGQEVAALPAVPLV